MKGLEDVVDMHLVSHHPGQKGWFGGGTHRRRIESRIIIGARSCENIEPLECGTAVEVRGFMFSRLMWRDDGDDGERVESAEIFRLP